MVITSGRVVAGKIIMEAELLESLAEADHGETVSAE